MKKTSRTDRIIIGVLLAIAAIILVTVLRENAGRDSLPKNTDTEVKYTGYNGKKIGILTGTNMEAESFRFFPDSEYLYFDGYPNLNAALLSGVVDAYLGDEPALINIHKEEPRIDYIRERLVNDRYSFAFSKNDPDEKRLCEQLNRFLRKIKADGTYEEMYNVWFVWSDEDRKTVDMSGLTGENGTIRVITTSTDEPFSYIKDGKHVGYDIDVVVRFCRDSGYALEIGDVDFQARIPAIASGQYEFTTSMNVTPEREESVLFSEPVSEGSIVVAVRSEDLGTLSEEDMDLNFWERIQRSFERNFVRENRWKLILWGTATTCLITLSSVLAGGVLAFLVCMFRRTGSRLANRISDLYVKLLQGTPSVVLLMILYYVVFKKTGIQAVWVAVIGFSLNFGAYASEILRSGINGIDKGQREAALALGFTENQAFFHFILPQAAVNFLPVCRGEIISLLKSTAVVGYIAVQDLTKMSDIVRSRTYEAFFPLITTALIYFMLAWLISVGMKGLLRIADPKTGRRKTAGRSEA